MPRKLEETVRVANTIKAEEIWTDIKVNEAISDDKFSWRPPADWREWKRAPIKSGLLKAGSQAPNFKLSSIDGDMIKLSDFRGNFVWLFKWRVG
jgi:hypothetical protein